MDGTALIAAAGLMGLAGLPHCAAMCAAPCAALTRGSGASQLLFQSARVAGYAAAGALAAASVGALRDALAWSAALRPLWTLLQVAALAVGLWMLVRGRWPEWLARTYVAATPVATAGWQRIAAPARSTCAAAAWIAWPCALSQAALLVAALGDTPAQGASAMAVFAVVSSPALWIGPMVVQRWARPGQVAALANAAWPVRIAGGLLALGAGWALGHGLWERVVAWCT